MKRDAIARPTRRGFLGTLGALGSIAAYRIAPAVIVAARIDCDGPTDLAGDHPPGRSRRA